MNCESFINHYLSNAPQLMWFLGAGSSRAASMPSATDIIWDLKCRYYCLNENQDIKDHDINKHSVKRKIQEFMDSKGFPEIWSQEEYSFYFDLIFGDDYQAQQKYLNEALSSEKISLNIGNRVLAGLLETNKAKIIFTTNFDEVVETAYSEISKKSLPTFHLEGSYAAMDALNAERFPIYAKIHGDFRYRSIKNLSNDLKENDLEIQKCFLSAADRYGLVVCGYSGRDENVMNMFRKALNQNNPFPQGLFWTVTEDSNLLDSVNDLIREAKDKGINAHVVKTGTFDILMSKIWRQLPDRPEKIDKLIRTSISKTVNIPLPVYGKGYPILRTNALPILKCPDSCAEIRLEKALSYQDIKNKKAEFKPNAIITRTDKILAWGNKEELTKVFEAENIKSIDKCLIESPKINIGSSTYLKAFYEEALAYALRQSKPLYVRKDYNRYYLVVNHHEADNPVFNNLKKALGYKGNLGLICGSVSGSDKALWAEAVSIKLELRNNCLFLLIRPDIWISPLAEKRNNIEFLKSRKRFRYNMQSYQILDSWIEILIGSIGHNQEISIQCFEESDFPIEFIINTRSAYSRKESVDAS